MEEKAVLAVPSSWFGSSQSIEQQPMQFMKPFLGLAICYMCLLSASAQLYTSTHSKLITTAIIGTADLVFNARVDENIGPSSVSYFVSTYLTVDRQDGIGSLLQSTEEQTQFFPGEFVSESGIPYKHRNLPPGSLAPLVTYSYIVEYPGARISASPVRDYFPDQKSILIGFSRDFQGQPHYGWIRLEREITRAEDFLNDRGRVQNYSFLPVAVAEHPVPNLPIRAGFPPELPPIESQIIDGEPGSSAIRLRWPEGLQGVRLEQADELKQPIHWVPVPDVSGNEALVPLPLDGQIYFRLHHAP
jgi:hypothetical protein